MYYFKDHTADLIIVAESNSLEELFEDLGSALISLIKGENDLKGNCKELSLSYKASFKEDLIVGFLEQILFVVETKGKVPLKIKLKNVSLSKLIVEYYLLLCDGEPTSLVKAPTYHNIKFETSENSYKAEVVLDV